MDVHFTPDIERRLTALAAKTGRAPEDLLEDAIPYLEELVGVREMLDSRYDDLRSGRVRPISGDEVDAYFREKSAAARVVGDILAAARHCLRTSATGVPI